MAHTAQPYVQAATWLTLHKQRVYTTPTCAMDPPETQEATWVTQHTHDGGLTQIRAAGNIAGTGQRSTSRRQHGSHWTSNTYTNRLCMQKVAPLF